MTFMFLMIKGAIQRLHGNVQSVETKRPCIGFQESLVNMQA